MTTPLTPFQQRADNAARWLVVGIAFSVSLPTAWVGLFTALFFVSWLAAGQFQSRWQSIRQHPTAVAALILFTWIAIATNWSPAGYAAAAHRAWQFRELLILPLMLSVAPADRQARERWQNLILTAFLCGFALSLCVSFLRWFGVMPERGAGRFGGFVGHTGFSIQLALVAYICFNRLFPPQITRCEGKEESQCKMIQHRWLWVALGLICLGNLFFINTGRTGQLVFLAFIPLALYSRIGGRGLIMSVLAVPLIAATVYAVSPRVSQHIQQSLKNLEMFKQGQTDTSDGTRLEYWQNTLTLIQQAPIFGNGTGGLLVKYRELGKELGYPEARMTSNPHNEFLLFTVEQGLIGLTLFLYFWIAHWRTAGRLSAQQAELLRVAMVMIIAGDLVNSLLLDNFEGHLYAIMTVAFGALGSSASNIQETKQSSPLRRRNINH